VRIRERREIGADGADLMARGGMPDWWRGQVSYSRLVSEASSAASDQPAGTPLKCPPGGSRYPA
jgi:hypothetical protein